MGTKNKGLSGGISGGMAGFQIGGVPGAIGGALLGGVLAEGTGGEAPQQVQQVDPAFVTSLFNQSMGTEKTAADLKMKAAFDQTLAQQVAAARAARGVNPALLQRNVARISAEQGAKAIGATAEANLQNQDMAKMRYLQAMQLNQNAQKANTEAAMLAEARDQKQLGSLINSIGAIGETYATADATKKAALKKENAEKISNIKITPEEKTASDRFDSLVNMPETSTETAAQITNAYSMGTNPNAYSRIGQTARPDDAWSKSDKRSKTKIKNESDLVVTSDERQKDLIKNESLPQNGNMGMQNQQAMQPQGSATPPMAAFAPPQAPAAPQAPQTPAAPQAPVAPPAPTPASQTALAQANASMSKGGRIDDLQMQQMTMPEVAEGPSQLEIQQMLSDAQRRETRAWDGSVDQSADDNYAANLQRWYAKQAADRAEYAKQKGEVNKANMQIDAERQARLSKFYTGNSNTNANDVASRYLPRQILNNTNFHVAQNQQAALGIQNLSARGPGVRFDNSPEAIARQAAADEQARLALTAQSDERSKENIAPQSKVNNGSMNPKDFLDKLTAYSYEYKASAKNDPNAGHGKHLSVMAQDLEKAGPVGQSMVKQDASGVKQVDYGKGFGAILAAQVQLNERLNAIEAKKSKKG